MELLKQLYQQTTSLEFVKCEPIPGAGSNRKYYRIYGSDGSTLVGVIGTSAEENKAFCYFSDHFSKLRLPVPEVISHSEDYLRYLQTDLGDFSLYDALKSGREAGGRYNNRERKLLRQVIGKLPDLQIVGARNLDLSMCYPLGKMDETSVLFDLNYFKYCFLKPTGLDFHEMKLEACFKLMAKDLTALPLKAFMYRDFQARNIMLYNGQEPYFIDFQGGRMGPVQYDLASFLWQASARYSPGLRQELISVYLEKLKTYMEVNEQEFYQGLELCVLFRTLQVLGAYGFRGYYEKKQHFIDSIPPAIQNLQDLLKADGCPYPYLHEILLKMVELPHFQAEKSPQKRRDDGYKIAQTNPYPANPLDGPPTFSKYDGKGPLVVKVYSFSFHKGIPEDKSGNGGGYVFDCRSTHNPGRYEPYKKLTGLDDPVIRFLEDDGEIVTFLDHIYKIVDVHVNRYLQRGFTSLMCSFGCTGGQHRSVYCAQHLGEHIHEKFGIQVQIIHREQGISQVLSPARAMIFAAGLGTRLKPLTDKMPKALVEVGGKPLLQHLLDKLAKNGFQDVVINLHHFPDMIEDWCMQHEYKHIWFSDERDCLLDTGGGVKHAVPLLKDVQDGFLIHNVDIISNVDLKKFTAFAKDNPATLLVSERDTQRYLLFSQDMRLVGWTSVATGEVKSPYPNLNPDLYQKMAFAGIHFMKPTLFKYFTEFPDKFSIIDFYLKICDRERIVGYVQPGLQLMDVGKIENLPKAAQFAKKYL